MNEDLFLRAMGVLFVILCVVGLIATGLEVYTSYFGPLK